MAKPHDESIDDKHDDETVDDIHDGPAPVGYDRLFRSRLDILPCLLRADIQEIQSFFINVKTGCI